MFKERAVMKKVWIGGVVALVVVLGLGLALHSFDLLSTLRAMHGN